VTTRRGVAGILNYVPVSSRLGTAGQPKHHQFRAIREAGYEVVVNLALPTSTGALPDEAELVAEEGLEYMHIPVVWESPSDEDLDRFFRTMERAEGRRVFVHCALNMRVSCFVYLYRVICQQVPAREAWADVTRIWQPNAIWQSFIEASLGRYGMPHAD
jgi:protein tyrosine phosphatase (PTP) superfamily phosphohydrolase (DUF442 family)